MHPSILNGKTSGQVDLTGGQDGTLVEHSEDPDGSTG
jgi:hypothetical protein